MSKENQNSKIETNVNFAKLEEEILKYWKENNIFEKSVKNRISDKDHSEFVFYDGPPFANGLPHYGHLLTGFIKDTYARYQTNKGKRVERRFGWDCHGLPAEMEVEKELGVSGRIAITEYGIDKFNEQCKNSVMKYSAKWEDYVTRQGRWVDFHDSYKTMDISYMESVIWVFKELYKKNLIYKSLRVMPYSYACETPLSNFETRLDSSYRQKIDKAVTVAFELNKRPDFIEEHCEKCLILAWTTTPWTLPSNLALAVSPDMNYSVIKKGNNCYILGEFAVGSYKKELELDGDLFNSEQQDNFKIEHKIILGSQLAGLTYKPLFNYFSGRLNCFRILEADFIVEGEGTGIVHMAPGFGEDDQIACEKAGIELVCPVDNAGKFTEEIKDLEGLNVFDANDKIIIKLKTQGNWIKTEQYVHNYPHCWRTDTPLIYKAVPSWYVKVTAIKERMIELNQKINWIPESTKNGLFGKWLENARDWSISRNRFFGAPIPIWESTDPKYPRIDVYGSIEELERDFNVKITDLHRPFIDKLTRKNPDDPTGKSIMKRVEDVLDCWFESGSMPYGQAHYPFENKKWFERNFPADFIVEYSAQTRGWFYTLMVLSTALMDDVPFLNCICHGVILDSTGQKLSKRLRNYTNPLDIFNQYGSDAMRVMMLSSSVVKGGELLIDKNGKDIFNSLKLFINPIWNAYHFFCIYANIDKIKVELNYNSHNILDRYIFSKLKIVVHIIETSMDKFDTQTAYNSISNFFEVLNNWYIRRSRERFWKSEKDQDKIDAYNSLYSILLHMMEASASLIPIISEYIYLSLSERSSRVEKFFKESVHLTNFPSLDNIIIDKDLVVLMDEAIAICSSALFIRNEENIRIRQPLSKLTIIAENAEKFKPLESLIKDEVNVKSIEYSNEVAKYSRLKLSINFPILAKRLPDKIKEIISMKNSGNWKNENGELIIAGERLISDEYMLFIEPNIDTKHAKSLSNNMGLVMLDVKITEELKNEGMIRDLIRIIQQMRKDANLQITDHIKLHIETDVSTKNILEKYIELITSQTLAVYSSEDFKADFSNLTTLGLCDSTVKICFTKISS